MHDWTAGDRVVVYPGLFCGLCEWCFRGETSACLSYGVIGEQCWGSHADYLALFGGPRLARAAERGRMLTT